VKKIHCDRCDKTINRDTPGLEWGHKTNLRYLCLVCCRAFAAFMAMGISDRRKETLALPSYMVNNLHIKLIELDSEYNAAETLKQIAAYCRAHKLNTVADLFPKQKTPEPEPEGLEEETNPKTKQQLF